MLAGGGASAIGVSLLVSIAVLGKGSILVMLGGAMGGAEVVVGEFEASCAIPETSRLLPETSMVWECRGVGI